MNAKSIIKKIALALAGVAALTAVGFGVKAIVDYTKNDLKTINLSYDVGNLGADGKFVDNAGTLYTKEAFACYGLQVKPDFDSTVNYQIFYYDILDNYISSTSVLSDGFSDEAPINGAYARIVIEPRDDEDGKISLTERVKYPSQLIVKVKKEQNVNERYITFCGRPMQVCVDLNNLVFESGLTLETAPFAWKFMASRCVTSKQYLKVDGGSTISYDPTSIKGESYAPWATYFEFSGLPSEETYIGYQYTGAEAQEVVLNKKAQYVILLVDFGASITSDSAVLAKVPKCFTITKTK